MGDRIYPPQPWIHQADCDEAPRGLETFKATTVADLHPLGRPHVCFDADTIVFNRDCVAETVAYEPHPYVRSTIWPEDATGPLCHTCRGSHPESKVAAAVNVRRSDQPLMRRIK